MAKYKCLSANGPATLIIGKCLIIRASCASRTSNSSSLLQCLEKAVDPDYHPTHSDILSTRPPNQVDERRLRIGNLDYLFIDSVGDWCWNDASFLRWRLLPLLEPVLAVIFVLDLSCYDQPPSEGNTSSNRIEAALQSFGLLINSPWMREKGVILIFIGWDAFSEKVSTSPLRQHLPGFKGNSDTHTAFDYILSRFISLNEYQMRLIHAQICNMGDGTAMRFIVRKMEEFNAEDTLKNN